MDYVLEDMQVMSDFELHKLCLKYEVCEFVNNIIIIVSAIFLRDLTKSNVIKSVVFWPLQSVICACIRALSNIRPENVVIDHNIMMLMLFTM